MALLALIRVTKEYLRASLPGPRLELKGCRLVKEKGLIKTHFSVTPCVLNPPDRENDFAANVHLLSRAKFPLRGG